MMTTLTPTRAASHKSIPSAVKVDELIVVVPLVILEVICLFVREDDDDDDDDRWSQRLKFTPKPQSTTLGNVVEFFAQSEVLVEQTKGTGF